MNRAVAIDPLRLGSVPSSPTYGTFHKMFGGLVRDGALVTIEESTHRLTSYPDGLRGISDRSVIPRQQTRPGVVDESPCQVPNSKHCDSLRRDREKSVRRSRKVPHSYSSQETFSKGPLCPSELGIRLNLQRVTYIDVRA